MIMTGAEILVQALIDQGAELMFGYPGGTVLNIYDALYDRQTELVHVLSSHEQGAAHAADGYARSTGKTGVVLATSGPGATNLVTGIATAFLDSVPMVAITGNVALDQIGRDSFQEVDTTGITNPIVKHNYFLQDASEIEHVVREAFTIANSGRKGPVHIDIPKNVTAQRVEYVGLPKFEPRQMPMPDEAALGEAARLIMSAERPLVYAGGGVVFSDASSALRALCEKCQLPVCTSMMGISAMPHDHLLYLGMVGMHGTPTANAAIDKCDVLIAIGARFSDRVAGNRSRFAHNAKIIHVDVDPSEMSKNVLCDVAVLGDAKVVMEALTGMLPKREPDDWAHELVRHKAFNPLPQCASQGLAPFTILKELARLLTDEAVIVTDVGQHQMFVAQHFPFARPRSFLSSCGLGTMGYGMGASVGAKLGNPSREVVLVTGDGGFHMNMGELAVAVSQGLKVIVLVMNNRVLGMVHQWQTLFYSKRYAYTEIDRQTDYVKLAQAFGARGYRISSESEIRPVLELALGGDGPCVVDCVIDPSERVFPIIPPGGSGTDIIYTD